MALKILKAFKTSSTPCFIYLESKFNEEEY